MDVFAGFRRPWRRVVLTLGLGVAACLPLALAQHVLPAAAGHSPSPLSGPSETRDANTLTFGILPIGGPSESLTAWRPVLDDMGEALHRPVRSVSVSTYEGLAAAIVRERIDVAFLSGRMAMDAVAQGRMQVVAQLVRSDGSPGYRSILLVADNSPLRTLDDLFKQPGHWRYARAEPLSMSGYIVPESELFASRQLNSDLFFRHVSIDNHQNNALAVANGEADVAANNMADLQRFAERFPAQFQHLRILWRSSLIPHAVIVVRNDLPAAERQRIVAFITHYAKHGSEASAQLSRLKGIHDMSGFAPANNQVLVPVATIEYTLERRRVLAAQWVDDAAMRRRLREIEREHRALVRQLAASPTFVVSDRGEH